MMYGGREWLGVGLVALSCAPCSHQTIKRGRVGVMTEVILSFVAVCMVWFFTYAIYYMVTTREDEED